MKANNKIFCALLSIGLLSLTACSNNDDESLSGATGDVTLSFGITMNDGAATRAISANTDGTLKNTGWTTDDKVTVGITHGGSTTYETAKVNQTSNDGKRAYVNMNVSEGSISTGDAISVIYPALETLTDGTIDFASQDGTAASLSKYGLYKGSSTLEVKDNVARLKEDLGIAAQTAAYLGIKCTDGSGTALKVKEISVKPVDAAADWIAKTNVTTEAVTPVTDTDPITATPTAATTDRLYIAMPAANSGQRMTFTAITEDDKAYTVTKTWTGEAGGYYPVTLEMTESESTVASTTDALTNAISAGQDVLLGADVTFSSASGANLVPAKTQTIDLNGHTLTADNIELTEANSDVTIQGGTLELKGNYGVWVQQQSKLTLDGVKLTATKFGVACGSHDDDKATYKSNTIVIKNSAIESGNTGVVIENTGNDVTIENTTINHGWFGITQNGVIPGSKITLTNVNISGPYSGIYLSNKAGGAKNTLVVNGGKIHSNQESAIEVKSTDITVTGATLESDATAQNYSVSGGGSNAMGYGIALVGYATGTAYDGNTSFSGNTYNLAAPNAVKIGKYDGTSLVETWQEGY